jgi:catecholate siderophore receptor
MGTMQTKTLSATPLAAALALVLAAPAHADDAAAAATRKPKDLDTVTVVGEGSLESTSPKHTQPLLDTPQSVTVVPAELMQEQGVTTLRDALRNVPGISMQAGEGGVPAGDNLTLRGFSARTDLFIDGVRDFGGYSRDSFNLEQIEVVKGPASTHSGRGSTGGSINLASKAARRGDFNRASVSVGDNQLLRATADFNQELSESTAFRINLMGHKNEVNGRDAVENERWGVAPTLSFGLGSDTTATFSLFHLEQDNVPDYGQPWVPAANNALVESRDARSPVDRRNFYGLLARDYEDTRTDLATFTIRHAFNDNVEVRNLTRWGRSERDSIITAPRFLDNDSTDIRRTAKTRDSEDRILANVTDLTAHFATGSVQHTLLAGLEFAREESLNRARAATDGDLADLFNPDFNAPYTGEISADPSNDAQADADSTALYVFDTLEFNPRWQLSGGLRWDRFEVDARGFDRDAGEVRDFTREDDMLSGRAAVVFKPRDNGSVYLGYGTSFNPSAEGLSLSTATVELDPEESRTIEVGTKWDLFDGRLMLTSAVFRTEKTNARVDDPLDDGRLEVLEGEQRVDGFEVGFAGRITDAWTLFGGYAHLDSEVLDSTEGDVGNELGNTPRHSATLWTTYEVTDALQFGFGAQHVGSRFSNTSNTRMAKSYTLFDAMVGFKVSDALSLRLNGYNLSGKDYVDQVGGGHYTPGADRTFMLSADFSF